MKNFIVYGDSSESEANLVILSFEKAETPREAFESWLNSEAAQEYKDQLYGCVRVVEVSGEIHEFSVP